MSSGKKSKSKSKADDSDSDNEFVSSSESGESESGLESESESESGSESSNDIVADTPPSNKAGVRKRGSATPKSGAGAGTKKARTAGGDSLAAVSSKQKVSTPVSKKPKIGSSSGVGDGIGNGNSQGVGAALSPNKIKAVPPSPAGNKSKPSRPASAPVPAFTSHTTTASATVSTTSMDQVDITRGGDVCTTQAAIKLIGQYFRQQNRPYNVLQIVQNFHQRMPRSLVETALEERNLEKMGVRVKEYGKTKIYFPDQSKLPCHSSAAELDAKDREIAQLDQTLIQLQQQERQVKGAAAALQKEPRDAEIDGQLATLEERVRGKKERAAKVSAAPVEPHALRNAVLEHNFYRKEWVSRRRVVMDLAMDLAQGMDKKLKDTIAMVGIETDEDNGAVIPQPLVEQT